LLFIIHHSSCAAGPGSPRPGRVAAILSRVPPREEAWSAAYTNAASSTRSTATSGSPAHIRRVRCSMCRWTSSLPSPRHRRIGRTARQAGSREDSEVEPHRIKYLVDIAGPPALQFVAELGQRVGGEAAGLGQGQPQGRRTLTL